eukprot:RCo034144
MHASVTHIERKGKLSPTENRNSRSFVEPLEKHLLRNISLVCFLSPVCSSSSSPVPTLLPFLSVPFPFFLSEGSGSSPRLGFYRAHCFCKSLPFRDGGMLK